MEKSDFKVGQKVCVFKKKNRYSEEQVQEWEVIKVGTKYITLKNEYNSKDQFYIGDGRPKDSNGDYKMYISKQQFEEERAIKSIEDWIKNNFRGFGYNLKYSLQALQKAKKILEEDIK